MRFVPGHYLFLKAQSFPRAMLPKNCLLLGTDKVQVEISELTEATVYIIYTTNYMAGPQRKELT